MISQSQNFRFLLLRQARLRAATSVLAIGAAAAVRENLLRGILRGLTGWPALRHGSAGQGPFRRTARPVFASPVPLALAAGLGSLGMAGPAAASCSNANSGGFLWQLCQGSDGTDSKDEKDGHSGDAATVTNDSGTYVGSTSSPFGYLPGSAAGYGILAAGSAGGTGVDEGSGGAAGYVNLTNGGHVSLSSAQDGNFLTSLLLGYSYGGNGDNDNDNYRSNGGPGGTGNNVNLDNSGTLDVVSLNALSSRGFSAILAESRGGVGGNQNGGLTGDQSGGTGGPGWSIFVNNNGSITLGSESDPLGDLAYAWGISAQSVGGKGGTDNGGGGESGYISVNNGKTGDAPIYVNSTTTGSVRGIFTLSEGADGTASYDSTDDGGAGALALDVSISTHSDITVIGTGGVGQISGGIVALNQGGDGGTGYNSSKGGIGGAGVTTGKNLGITVNAGATVSAQGDEVMGVVGLARGGTGGNGKDGESASSGGNGGYGGWVYLTIDGDIETDGTNAYGLLGQSIGGQGGNGGSDTALLGQSGGGGYGGNADTAQGTMSGSITTLGDFSSAVTLHSIGGGGGTGGDFTDVLGGGAGNGGNGGDGDYAMFSNDGGTITTSGDHSLGILVQSIGGSGGTGGIAAGLTLELGGDGGSGGSAGEATAGNGGQVATAGYGAHGIVAQSISGGGGNAGMAGGVLSIGGSGGGSQYAGDAEVDNSGDVSTAGDAAVGIVVQSIGGGGGSGAGSAGIATVGGSGGSGGYGLHARALLTGGSVTTQGEMSHGIMAQSIGGGGGNGGNVIDLSVGVPAVGVGGTASGGSSGGWACVTNLDASNDCTAGDGTPQAVAISTAGSGALGILAQSVGGGGGNGGNATGGDAGLGSFQIGGGGGGGGYANTVTVAFDGLDMTTQGSHAAGIVAQSIGGGGGTGGSASSYSADVGFTASVAVGGSGANGGAGGEVIVELTDSTVSTGQAGVGVTDAIGILAQSVSGGGGSGGSSVADALTAAVPTGEDVSLAMSVSTAIGGSGGSAKDADAVTLTLDGSTQVSTRGVSSHGLVAQSIGGGGGNGGSASSMSATAGIENTVSADIGVSVGGSGSGGGNGGAVTVSLADTASIVTADDYANALVAQTIGGGGGNGGVGSVNSKQIGGGFKLAANVGVGGSGSGGAAGGTASVTLGRSTLLQTGGSGARGVLVQSIGGGGGTSQGVSVGLSASDSLAGGGEDEESGGSSAFAASVGVAVGRSGGSGGSAGAVDVTTGGNIVTAGADADGVLAQSIGGGGGLGGSVGQASSGDSEPLDDSGDSDCSEDDSDDDSGYCFNVSIGASIDDGGSGGTAADGKAVTLVHSGHVTTHGDWADGIVAQSIGGGGGAGGTSTAAGSQGTANITVGVGGKGGAGGSGGTVGITFNDNTGNGVATSGYSAYGVLLQSVGGGGGQGGDGSDSAAGKITVGAAAGGSGGSGGSGGTVTAAGWINLSTHGADAHGIVAQSIGGGGGTGGAGSSAAAEDSGSHQIELVVGGAGSAGGIGGTVDLRFGTTLNTYGKRAFGVVAQSIGGGGGIGGAGEAESLASLVVGGAGGGTVDGGTVSVEIKYGSTVYAHGAAAHALIAQSIGGGGGIGGSAAGAPLSFKGLSDGSEGNGGDVSVTIDDALVRTDGDDSFAIIAQSIGGGGGFGGDGAAAFIGSNGNTDAGLGHSGTVAVDIQSGAHILAKGANSAAIFAQSDSLQTNGAVQVTVDGTVTGGTGELGAGIIIAGGTNEGTEFNALTVGSGGSVSAASGVAVIYRASGNLNGGGLDITNGSLAQIQGSIEAYDADGDLLYSGTGGAAAAAAAVAPAAAAHPVTVHNQAGGRLTGATLYQADVLNEGRLDIGDSGRAGTLSVAGNFVQAATGSMHADADFLSGNADVLQVDGTATLGGTLSLDPMSILYGAEMTVLSADGGISGSFDTIDSALFTFDQSVAGSGLALTVSGDTFSDASHGLDGRQDSVAAYLSRVFRSGDDTLAEALAELDAAARDGGYGEALLRLSPGASLAAEAASFELARGRFSAVLDCSASAAAWSDGERCLQLLGAGQRIEQDGEGDAFGYDGNVYTIGIAGSAMMTPDWRIGGALGWETAGYDGEDGHGDSEGETLFAGISAMRGFGPVTLAAAGVVSRGSFDTTRRPGLTAGSGEARGSHDLTSAAARLRASYRRDFGASSYLTPMMDLDMIWTRSDGYSEKGAGELALDVDGSEETALVATPALEAGHGFALDGGAVLQVYGRAGVSLSSLDHYRTSAHFSGTDPSAGSFDSDVAVPDVVGRFSAGARVAGSGNLSLDLRYDGAFGSGLTSHAGSLSVSYRF
ncbi:autotransporter outer membrane beta-barrel domain-containing protein [Mangrovicoccus sp. HB161399]|uniref:autotransporter outer membrane beta-barrel domain-containing protein n=1 Tax=Mangrovicoccus sp. HB161399 TaxID=2720392 RepID=UPI0015537371|nr:autotransporter outer membrane beta-barrel domain-containing protein [Mangrovicoccus sp. HB161399]